MTVACVRSLEDEKMASFAVYTLNAIWAYVCILCKLAYRWVAHWKTWARLRKLVAERSDFLCCEQTKTKK